MSTNTTPNYGMHSWAGTDYVKRSEFNDNFTTIDTQMKANATSASTANTNINNHTANTSNPHNVTAMQVGLGNVTNVAQAALTDFNNHTAATTVHGSTSAATVNAIMQRDANGRSQVASPAAAADIARKDYVDTVQTNLNNHAASTTAHTNATESANGFMSAADKTKLDGISTGAQVNAVTSVNSKTGAVSLSYTDVGAAASNHTHPDATESVDGFLSAADKTKLDGIATGAQVNSVTSVAGKTGAVTLAAADVGALGVSDQAADSLKLNGQSASFYLTTTGQAADSAKLGGQLPSYYLTTTGQAADSAKLNGQSSSYYLAASQVGIANGTASLDGSGHIPTSQLVNATTTKASVQDVQLTGTAVTTVTSYTPTAQGNFEVGVYIRVVTAATNVTINITYNSASGAQAYQMLPTTSLPVGDHMFVMPFFNALITAAITVQVTAGTASQVYVSASISSK